MYQRKYCPRCRRVLYEGWSAWGDPVIGPETLKCRGMVLRKRQLTPESEVFKLPQPCGTTLSTGKQEWVDAGAWLRFTFYLQTGLWMLQSFLTMGAVVFLVGSGAALALESYVHWPWHINVWAAVAVGAIAAASQTRYARRLIRESLERKPPAAGGDPSAGA